MKTILAVAGMILSAAVLAADAPDYTFDEVTQIETPGVGDELSFDPGGLKPGVDVQGPLTPIQVEFMQEGKYVPPSMRKFLWGTLICGAQWRMSVLSSPADENLSNTALDNKVEPEGPLTPRQRYWLEMERSNPAMRSFVFGTLLCAAPCGKGIVASPASVV